MRLTSLPSASPARLVVLACGLLAACYLLLLATAASKGYWITRGGGQYVASDFVAFYTAGRMALAGDAVQVYDWARHHALAEALIGPFVERLPWLNPPHFLLVVTPFAALPFGPSMLAWVGATLAVYAATIGRIVGTSWGWLAAVAFPGAVINAASGQAGLLNAALLGGGLLLLPARPLAAGMLFGALTVKPQLGLLIPLALVAGGHWRAVSSAAATTVALAGLSAAIFSPAIWENFLGSLAGTGDAVIGQGLTGFGKMQSVYGLVRHLGLGAEMAWAATAVVSLAVAALVVVVWRGRAPFELKAALIAVGTLLVQPYVFIYDAAILAVALAFLVRHALARGFLDYEALGMVAVCLPLVQALRMAQPLGLLSGLIVLGLVLRRLARREPATP